MGKAKVATLPPCRDAFLNALIPAEFYKNSERVEFVRYRANDIWRAKDDGVTLLRFQNQHGIKLPSPHIAIFGKRWDVFYDMPFCVSCGLVAKLAIVDQWRPREKSPNIRLYGVGENKLVLFTLDHIVPKSLGGPDTVENFQTMCYICNQKKGNRSHINPFKAAIEKGNCSSVNPFRAAIKNKK